MQFPTEEEAKRYWDALIKLLADNPLNTSTGQTRIADVGEFMLMHRTPDGIVGFKHRCTRNYLFIVPVGTDYALEVPTGIEAFMRGTFDLFQ